MCILDVNPVSLVQMFIYTVSCNAPEELMFISYSSCPVFSETLHSVIYDTFNVLVFSLIISMHMFTLTRH